MIPSDIPAIILVALVLLLAGAWFLGVTPDQIAHACGIS